jgi:hypothetical protein
MSPNVIWPAHDSATLLSFAMGRQADAGCDRARRTARHSGGLRLLLLSERPLEGCNAFLIPPFVFDRWFDRVSKEPAAVITD